MPDTATQALENILHSNEYECESGIPVFDEHDEYDADGKLLQRYDRERLEKIADICNRKARDTGDLAPIGIGHTTKLPAPETEQPPIVGFAHNYRVGKFGPAGVTALLVDYYMRKDAGGKALLKQFPRRSIELWRKRGDIDWIALLKRAPERPLGLVVPSGDLTPTFAPGSTVPASYSRRQGDDEKVFYSAEQFMPDPTAPPDAAAAPDPQSDAIERYMAAKLPKLAEMHAKYMAEMAQPPAAPAPVPPGGAPPEVKKEEGVPDEKARMQRDSDAIRLQRMESELSVLRFQAEKANCEKDVIQLEAEGFLLDRAREVESLARMSADQRKAHTDHIRRYYRQDPTAKRDFVRVAETAPAGGAANLTNEDEPQITHYMRERLWDRATAAKYVGELKQRDQVVRYMRENKMDDFMAAKAAMLNGKK